MEPTDVLAPLYESLPSEPRARDDTTSGIRASVAERGLAVVPSMVC